MRKHLAIFTGKAGEQILTGKKTIESRFSRVKNPPFGEISGGDLVYIKPSGEEVIGQFRVKKVFFYDNLDLSDLSALRNLYGEQLAADKDYWEKHKNARFGTLIFIGDSAKFITSPIKIPKKDLRGWVVLG
ncbi:ASCH domain-containing protein [Candidatus Daviesbacteria bacterium]|nr:ASCH domain-containing protein [Candidatus Daviesbacteria bacterium]